MLSLFTQSTRRNVALGSGLGLIMLASIIAPAQAEMATSQPSPSESGASETTSAAQNAASKAFVLIEYQVRNQQLFVKLRDQVRETIKSYKGDLVTREKVQPILGSKPTNVSIISFPTIEDARTWLKSKELSGLTAQRDEAAKVTIYLVEKID